MHLAIRSALLTVLLLTAPLLMALQASSPALAQEGPLFPDKALEAVVRKYVFEKRNNDQPLVEADVQNISTIEGKFRAGDKITNLAGLEKCRSLLLLDLAGHGIADLGPLRELSGLQSLDLSGNQISDLGPLQGLTALQYLQLEGNQITDLAPLSKLTALRSLYLSQNQIKDVKPLEGLNRLWSLYLGGNQVTDLQPLAGLTRIDVLDLQGNGVADLKPLAGYTELSKLFLQGNQITDLSVLVEMAKRDAEGEKRFAPFLRVYLGGNPLSDEARKVQLPELKRFVQQVQID